MKPRRVTTPSGEAWTVRRCWVAKRPVKWRGRMPFGRSRSSGRRGRGRPERGERGDWSDWPEGLHFLDVFDENPLAAVLGIVAIIAIAVLGSFFLVPLVLALVDLTILILLTLLGIAARVVLRRPWEIEAVGPRGRRLTWQVVGWQRSRRTITAVADHLTQGQIPPADSPSFPPP